jgi:cytochrome c oxidase subunit II
MARTRTSRIRFSLRSPLLLICLALQTAESALAQAVPGDPSRIPSVFRPESTPAHSIHELSILVLAITGLIFAVVFGLILYAIVRYRQRPGDDGGEPAQVYGSTQVEVAWTVIPILIVVVLPLTGARAIDRIQNPPKPPGALDVTAIGHQWWWEFQYPALGIVTANELHVPVSVPARPSPTYLKLLSADVAHSFWVPRLAGKMDLIPNRVNQMWIEPDKPGLYLGQCAEYCSTQHAKMLLRVYVHTREDFERWASEQRRPSAQVPSVAEGRRVFETTACISCHAVGGTVGTGIFGPDLTHLMSRATLASGAALNTPENLRIWIQHPEIFKPGSLMPGMNLTERELDQLVAYLATLR